VLQRKFGWRVCSRQYIAFQETADGVDPAVVASRFSGKLNPFLVEDARSEDDVLNCGSCSARIIRGLRGQIIKSNWSAVNHDCGGMP
jgi:hypothetical protein